MRLGVLAVLLALAVSGCATIQTRPGLTRAHFIARADAICQAEQLKIRRKAAARQMSVASTPRMIREAVAIHEAVGSKLESLPEPVGQQAAIAGWLTARTVATTIESDAGLALAKRLRTTAGVQRERARASERVKRLARAYGFEACGVLE